MIPKRKDGLLGRRQSRSLYEVFVAAHGRYDGRPVHRAGQTSTAIPTARPSRVATGQARLVLPGASRRRLGTRDHNQETVSSRKKRASIPDPRHVKWIGALRFPRDQGARGHRDGRPKGGGHVSVIDSREPATSCGAHPFPYDDSQYQHGRHRPSRNGGADQRQPGQAVQEGRRQDFLACYHNTTRACVVDRLSPGQTTRFYVPFTGTNA